MAKKTRKQRGSGTNYFSRAIFKMNRTPTLFKSVLHSNIPTPKNFAKKTINNLLINGEKNNTKYFDNSHVFLLSGHGIDTGKRYRLKDNEYYASPTQCGRVSVMTSERLFYDWIVHNPSIKIPNSSYAYTLNYTNFPFKESSQLYHNIGILEKPNSSIDNWKIYFPQSQSSKTNSIPSFSFGYFNYHHDKIIIPIRITNRLFTYNGKTQILSGFYNISLLSYSGILQPNSMTTEFQEKVNALNAVSETINNDFLDDVMSEQIKNGFLILIYPISDFNSALYSSQEPYALYLKDALDVYSSLSFIDYKDYIDLENPSLKLKDVVYLQIDSERLFSDIRKKLGDEKPMFILNPLCRGFSPSVRDKSIAPAAISELAAYAAGALGAKLGGIKGAAAGFGTGLVAGKQITSKITRHYANKEGYESNNQADDQSFYPGSSRATQRQTRKNKKKGWFF